MTVRRGPVPDRLAARRGQQRARRRGAGRDQRRVPVVARVQVLETVRVLGRHLPGGLEEPARQVTRREARERRVVEALVVLLPTDSRVVTPSKRSYASEKPPSLSSSVRSCEVQKNARCPSADTSLKIGLKYVSVSAGPCDTSSTRPFASRL